MLAFVVPCFNEEKALPILVPTLVAELERLGNKGLVAAGSCIYLVDDGSDDNTWPLITALQASGQPVAGLKLTRNFGHQNALYAGLMEADADVLISMDADLQDDIGVVEAMLQAAREGHEIVYAVREDRSTDTAFKRLTAQAHYWFSDKLGIETVKNHADFRLMSRRAVELLSRFDESNMYLRGIIPLLGLRTSVVTCRRAKRVAGDSKYDFWKMLSLSVRGITSFSIAPLRFISAVGVVIFLFSIGLGVWALYAVFVTREAVPGWASTVLPIYLLGGFQLFALGIVGEYIGKAYMEVKRRPRYLLEARTPQPTGKSG